MKRIKTTGSGDKVSACGELLAEHFPATGEEDNALPDHLVEL